MTTPSVRPASVESLLTPKASTGPAWTAWVNPLAFVRERFRKWWQSKLPFTDQLLLTQRNVYILPTRPGLMLGVTLLTLLVASINYQLNLGYLLTFLLAGSALIGMHVCHGTLRGLAINLIASDARFAGASAIIDIKLVNLRRSARHGIGLGVLNPLNPKTGKPGPPHWVWTDVPAQGSSSVQVAFTPPARGVHRLPTLTAETRFPLGTFRVWTVWRPAAQILVYPTPEAYPPPLPPGEPRSGGAATAARAQNTGEFDGVRGYRRGDPMKLVVWKKAAKADEQASGENGGLVVRVTQQAQRHELWLDFMHAGSADTEHKLSRLCAWVLNADKLGLDYGLRLPALEVKPGSGEVHKRRCLEALALC